MRRLLALLLVAALTYVGIDVLADLTQTRPETIDPNSRAEVTIGVEIHGYLGPFEDAAQSLWAVCLPQLGWRTQVVEAPVIVDGHLTAVVSPAPGAHSEKRLRGCLNDVTLDRVKGHLVSVTQLPALAAT